MIDMQRLSLLRAVLSEEVGVLRIRNHVEYGGLNENGPHKISVWEALKGVALWEEVSHWGVDFEV